jgi:hypothetical protein
MISVVMTTRVDFMSRLQPLHFIDHFSLAPLGGLNGDQSGKGNLVPGT